MPIYIVTSTTGDKWEICPSTWIVNQRNRQKAIDKVQNCLNGKANGEKVIDCKRFDQGEPTSPQLLQEAIVE